MTQNISILSQAPYFDDFDPSKDFVRVLFRPSYPVQARELTTLQTFLQEQITRFGNHVFKDGSRVTGGSITISNDAVRLDARGASSTLFPAGGVAAGSVLANLATLEGLTITNSDGTVKARVVRQPIGNLNQPVGSLFVKYVSNNTFEASGDYIYATPTDNPGLTTTLYNTYESVSPCTLGNIAAGVYYVKGIFIRVAEQTTIVDATSNTPTVNIGFSVTESIVTQNEDTTLFDNARGTTNEGSPGAHRLKVNLNFITKAVDAAADESFYRIVTITNGNVVGKIEMSEQYAGLLDTLARRTYDESGHYALKPFTHTVSAVADTQKFNISVGPSKAYVRGYEITKNFATDIVVDKGLSDVFVQANYNVPFVGTSRVDVTSVTGVLPGQNGGNPYLSSNRLLLRNASGHNIGIAKGYSVAGEVTGGSLATRLYLFDIKMFTVVTTTNGATFVGAVATGNDVSSVKARAQVYKDDTYAGVANSIALINVSGRFRTGQAITSGVNGATSTIASVLTFGTSDITRVVGSADGFDAIVTTGTFANGNSELINTLSHRIKTYKDAAGQITDNNYSLVTNTGASNAVNPSNGIWNTVNNNEDDGTEIKKNLKFKYIKVKNNNARSAFNYGWVAQDKEVSLFYPDIYKVYKVTQSTNGTFAGAQFDRINISTTAIIPQGALVTGVTSGTVAIVALSNSSATGSGTLSSNADYHSFIENTGLSSQLEVVYQKGSSFTINEQLTVKLLDTTAVPITNQITYLSSSSAIGQDVTGMYLLDDGQRAEFYDVGRLYRKDNVPAPTNDIVIFYAYFESLPNATQHYFNADSYSHLDLFGVDVRFYNELREIAPKNKNTGRNLRDSVDFRLQVTPVSAVTSSPFSFSSRTYRNQTRILPNTTFTTDFTEYLGRTDVLMLSKDGEFILKKGIAAAKPKTPEDVPDAMTLSTIFIPPAVRYPDDEVKIEIKNNRRYTMADIGKLDDRITNVEQAVALSLLESQALHDDVDGRTKMGFVVDDFSVDFNSGNSPADFTSTEFRASIDTISRSLIPAQTAGKTVSMTVDGTTNTSSFFPDYVINDFVQETLASQPKATGTYLINPFAVWLYRGQLRLTPSEDNWHIRSDNYFISRFGELQPVSAAEFNLFGQITTSSPGGASSTVREWVGAQTSERVLSSTDAAQNAAGSALTITRQSLGLVADITRQAQRTITTRTFESPRASGAPVETFNGTTVIENPQEYRMRSVTVAFSGSGLRPNTIHTGYFGGVEVLQNLVSDVNGELAGSFVIPANTFPVGTLSFELKDVDTLTQSTATAGFKSTGHIDSFTSVQNTAISVSTSSIQQGVVQRLDFSDPVAQLFMLPISSEAGVTRRESSILTSVDLWFGFVDDRPTMDKVVVEIRDAVNGYPGGPDKIIGTTGFITISKTNQVGVPSPANASNFKFLDPVKLVADKEYAIVIKSPSDATTVFIARIGDGLLGSGGIHDAQPLVGGYAGSFFKSQNSSTWEADQNVDLTFRLYRAKFDTAKIGTVNLSNTVSDAQEFNGDVGAFSNGLAIETFTGSKYVKVIHPNHGLNFDGAKVRLSGFGSVALNGIPATEINTVHTVLFATLDSYFIKVTTDATLSGRPPVPTFTAFATQCIVYDSMITNINVHKQEADEVTASVRTFTTNTVNLFVDNLNKVVNDGIIVPSANSFVQVPLSQQVEFDEPRIVRNLLNAVGPDVQMQLTLKSGTDYSSPFFKRGTNFSPILFRNVVGTSLTDSEIASQLTVRTVIAGDDENNQKHASYIAGLQSETEHSSYVTRQIDINLPADGFTIFVDADMEPESSVTFSYKAKPVGDEIPFDDLQWVDFPASQQINELNYGPFSSGASRTGYTLRATVPFEFTNFKIRARIKVRNEAKVPKLKDLRIVSDM